MALDLDAELGPWLAGIAGLAGIRSATLDPAQVVTPGVWCRVPSFGVVTLADDTYRVDVDLHVAAADLDWTRARKDLMARFGTLHDHLGKPRVDVVRFIKLELPGGAVPALMFPHALRIAPAPEEE